MHRDKPFSFRGLPLWLLLIPLLFVAPLAMAAEDAGEEIPSPKDLAELRSIQEQVEKVVPKIVSCTVGVQIGHTRGSGVIVSEDGLVLTAGHMVGKSGQKVLFFLPDGKKAKGTTLGAYKTSDAGLVKIEDKEKWPFAERGSSADLKPGTWCIAVGHPLGFQEKRPPVVRIGRVLRSAGTVIQTDCSLVGGDSGGPLFDLDGKVIGVNSRIGSSMQHNFHVPVDIFNDNWERLVKGDVWESNLPKRDHKDVKAMLREVVADAGQCVVKIKCDGKDVAMGTIVGPDGWILSKASELREKPVCRLRDNRELDARIIGVDKRFDLAMLKIDETGLPMIAWNPAKPSVGHWVAVPGLDEEPLSLGVVSVPPRAVPPARGVLGIALKDADEGATIEKVLPGSPAEKADLKKGDIVLKLDGEAVSNRVDLVTQVKRRQPGCEVTLTVKRGDEELEIKVKLARLDTPSSRKRDMQNSLGVGVSKRRDNFPIILQHDAVVRPVDCGGPIVDLSGKALGVNIARGGRTETYCIPSEVLMPLMYELMSGRMPPPEEKTEKEEPDKEGESEDGENDDDGDEKASL